MRIFANLFLILFLADGGLSLLDELLIFFSPVAFFSGARSILADVVLVMATLLYLCLGFDRRLPKRVFLPLILFVFWCPLSTWFFPVLAGYRTYGLLVAVVQVALGLLIVSRLRKGSARSLILPSVMFDARWFSLRNTLVFGAANLFVMPLALVLLALYAANSYMAEYSAGFMRIGPGGLYMTERTYRRDNRTIRLAGMIHVGDKKYYDELAESITPGRLIVLAEGVTDDQHLLRHRFDYGKVAEVLGLSSQDKMLFRGRTIEAEMMDEVPRPRSSRGTGGKEQARPADILRADVDVSSFRSPTLLLLDTIGKDLGQDSSTVKALLSLNVWAERNITPEMYDIIMDDILHRRNKVVTGYLGKALDRYETVVVPWGALHMKEIEEDVLKRGFKLQGERERVSVDFRKMLLGPH